MEKYKNIYSKYFNDVDLLFKDYPELEKLESDLLRQVSITSNDMVGMNIDNLNYILTIAETNSNYKVERVIQTFVETHSDYFKKDSLTRPICKGMLGDEKIIRRDMLDRLNNIINVNGQENRFKSEFGVYENVDRKIYEPILDKKELSDEYNKFFSEGTLSNLFSTKGRLSLIILQHLWFEKIHPYVDGNGRLGRFLMEHSFQRYFRYYFRNKTIRVIPISWGIKTNNLDYNDFFMVDEEINFEPMFKILIKSYKQVSLFISELKPVIDKLVKEIKTCTTKDNTEMFEYIASNLMFKKQYVIKNYNINQKTFDSIMKKLNEKGLYNYTKIGVDVAYVNIEIEELMNRIFN